MALIGGLLGTILTEVLALLSWLWASSVGVLGGLLGSLWTWLVAILGGLLGVLWGGVLVLALFLVAALLNITGVDDVHAVLYRRLGGGETAGADPVETVQSISPEVVTDSSGRFSSAAFMNVTGLTPAEFVHLFVTSNGGRVKQRTLNTCLPWSKATVTRILNELETDGVIERVTIGRENVVCTPGAVPDDDA